MTHICRRCGKEIPNDRPYNTDNGLFVTLDGGYGEFIDTPDPIEFVLCHECGHALADLIGLDVRNWHTHRADSGQHPDHHDWARNE